MDTLAIMGGTPIRDIPLSYGHQYIDEEDINAVVETLRGPYLTCGPKVAALEAMLCEITGAAYAVAVSNGTAALHLAALAAGFQPGDEVIVSSITFAASSNCVLYVGATPVFADINRETYNMDVDQLEALITPKTKGIIAVDFTGQSVESDKLRALCEKYGLIFIEDAAHAIGTKYQGRPVGSIADMTCFSFHPVKTVTGGEGGAVTTNDPELYKRLRLLRTHGITRDMELMVHPTDDPWYNEMGALGYNYRITDFQAALLCSQLKKLPMFSQRRKEIVSFYDKEFSAIPEIIVQKELEASDTTRHLYIIRLKLEKLTCSRRQFFDACAAEGVIPQVHYMPVYYHAYYEKLGYKRGLCPEAESLYSEILSIPLYYGLSKKDIEDVVAVVKKVIAYYRKN